MESYIPVTPLCRAARRGRHHFAGWWESEGIWSFPRKTRVDSMGIHKDQTLSQTMWKGDLSNFYARHFASDWHRCNRGTWLVRSHNFGNLDTAMRVTSVKTDGCYRNLLTLTGKSYFCGMRHIPFLINLRPQLKNLGRNTEEKGNFLKFA